MAEYIEREAAMEAVKQEREYVGKYSFEEERAWAVGFQQGVTFALSDISDIPAADVAPVKHGKWLDVWSSGFGSYSGTCSCCRNRNDIPPPRSAHYCPSCGAKMEDES